MSNRTGFFAAAYRELFGSQGWAHSGSHWMKLQGLGRCIQSGVLIGLAFFGNYQPESADTPTSSSQVVHHAFHDKAKKSLVESKHNVDVDSHSSCCLSSCLRWESALRNRSCMRLPCVGEAGISGESFRVCAPLSYRLFDHAAAVRNSLAPPGQPGILCPALVT